MRASGAEHGLAFVFLDFRDRSLAPRIETDICIIGAGAAGIALAREFIGSGRAVCLVESGGFEFDANVQQLYDTKSDGHYADGGRLRYFGGTTNHWTGRCVPLDAHDFVPRAWIPQSGWPLTQRELLPYYERAYPVCGLQPRASKDALWSRLKLTPPQLLDDRLHHLWWQWSAPLRFAEAYRDELEEASDVRVLLNANVTELVPNDAAKALVRANLAALDGRRGSIQARTFVLAMGGIENARLLLASNRVEPAGLGNRRDLVGRFFMVHVRGTIGSVATASSEALQALFNLHWLRRQQYQLGLALSPTVQKREQVANSGIWIRYRADRDSGIAAFRRLRRDVLAGRFRDDFGANVWSVISDLDDLASDAARRYIKRHAPIIQPRAIDIITDVEQVPDPQSRITLTTEADALGIPRPRITWRLADIERRTASVSARVVAMEFGRLGLGRVKLADWLEAPDWVTNVVGTFHHIGTTRMADEPSRGVVDRHCRIHGLANTYIAGSSVFPTSGHANPTLTIVALVLRLADHVKRIA